MELEPSAAETGLSKSSLRRYEALGLISPGRIDFGDTWVRVYTLEQIALLKEVKLLIDQGYRFRAAFERAAEDMANRIAGPVACIVRDRLYRFAEAMRRAKHRASRLVG